MLRIYSKTNFKVIINIKKSNAVLKLNLTSTCLYSAEIGSGSKPIHEIIGKINNLINHLLKIPYPRPLYYEGLIRLFSVD